MTVFVALCKQYYYARECRTTTDLSIAQFIPLLSSTHLSALIYDPTNNPSMRMFIKSIIRNLIGDNSESLLFLEYFMLNYDPLRNLLIIGSTTYITDKREWTVDMYDMPHPKLWSNKLA